MTPRDSRQFGRASFLPLLLAAPLAAQGLSVPTYNIDAKIDHLQVVTMHETPVAHVLLASLSQNTVWIGGLEFLADAVVIGMVPSTYAATFDLPVGAATAVDFGLHLQAVVLDGVEIESGPVVPAVTAFEPKAFMPKPGPVAGYLSKLDMRVDIADSGNAWFVANFEATSDGFAMRAAAVVRNANTSDVYLTLKTPGPGEGMNDVMQNLRLDIDLGLEPGMHVRVWAIEGPFPFSMGLGTYMPFVELEVIPSQ